MPHPDPLQRIFTATIDKTDSVHDLKRCIKAEKSPGFDHLAADELILWKLEPPSLVGRETDLQTALEALRALKLDDSTTEARRNHKHEWFLYPTSGAGQCEAFEDRAQQSIPERASIPGGSRAILQEAAGTAGRAICVLQPTRLRFFDPNYAYAPHIRPVHRRLPHLRAYTEDNALVLELCMEMSALFDTQEDRRGRFTSNLQSHLEINLIAGKLTGDGFSSGGHRMTDGFLDVCTVAAGAGLAYSDRPHMDMLGPLLPFSGHHYDFEMKTAAARSLGAFRNATRSLAKYYNEELPGLRTLPLKPNPLYPYPSSYRPLTGEPVHQDFKYLGKFGAAADNTRLLFYAETIGSARNQKDLIIKFVRRYSKAAHELCASLGYAPTLHGFEELPGGWFMVVMQRLPDSYALYHGLGQNEEAKATVAWQLLSDCVGKLHEANMVHGDMRGVNLLVRMDGQIGIKVVDFDWAGEVGVVRYPINVNRDGIARPDTARDGMLVAKEHDLDMIKFMFRP
ncbi:hypothetical protein HWV62_20394 [Athelia sp. TMB]|nr:hypothetical protein HWV62_20394 [Athelia sp. TMB]